MNTPIVKISDDEKTIIHESGFKSRFCEDKTFDCCENCVYNFTEDVCYHIPCTFNHRKDKKNGYFLAI